MATDQKVQIEVELVGVKEAEKNLKAIESGGDQIGESFSKSGDIIKKSADKIGVSTDQIGEGFSKAGEVVSGFESDGAEALGSVGESLAGVTEAFGGFSEAVKEGGVSLGNLAIPVAGAIIAIYELVKAYQDYRDEVDGVTAHVKAYETAMSEMTTIVEELAAKQVILTDVEAKALQQKILGSKVLIEEAQNLSENTKKFELKIKRAQVDIKQSKERIKLAKQEIESFKKSSKGVITYAHGYSFLNDSIRENENRIKNLTIAIEKNRKAQARSLAETAAMHAKGGGEFAKVEEFKENIAKRGTEFRKKLEEQNFKLDMESAAIKLKQQKSTLKKERDLAHLEASIKMREIAKLDDIDQETRVRRLQATQTELNQKLKQIDRANYERIKTARAARAKTELAEQKNRINAQSALEMARINQNLKGEEHATNRKIALADLAFNRASQLLDLEADKNANSQDLREALEINHQNRLAEIRDKAAADRVAKEQAAARELIANEMRAREDILEIERLRAEVNLKGQDRELELLRLDYEQRFMMAMDNQEKLTLLQEQYAQQRIAIQGQESEALTDQMSGFFGSYGQGLADAAVGAIMFGESFSDSVKAVLDGLAREAGVQALMELAKGTAALFTNPAGSGAHFKAAGMFTAAALLAKGAGAGLGGGSSASAAGASGQASSPSGAPQTASAPRREQAEESTMVFNVNFSNSVIYDTKQAAQDAMVDQLVRNINTPRRGSRRVRFANA